jgi:hypothetical protein
VVSDSGSNCCGANGIPSAFYWLAYLDHKLPTVPTVLTIVVNKMMKMENGVKSKPILPVQGRLAHVAVVHADRRVQEAGRVLQARKPAELVQQDAQAKERNSMELAAPLPSKHRGNVRQAHAGPANEGQAKQAQ